MASRLKYDVDSRFSTSILNYKLNIEFLMHYSLTRLAHKKISFRSRPFESINVVVIVVVAVFFIFNTLSNSNKQNKTNVSE